MPAKFLQPLLNVITKLRGHEYLANLNRQMHAKGRFKGVTWQQSLQEFQQAVPETEAKLILDFGCGPRGGLAEHGPLRVVSYDPYVEKYSRSPWHQPIDAIFSSDVLEHMTRPEIQEFLRHARQSTAQHIYLVVSTRAAKKRLPNGANAHQCVKPSRWWRRILEQNLGADFELTSAKIDLLRDSVSFCFQRTTSCHAVGQSAGSKAA